MMKRLCMAAAVSMALVGSASAQVAVDLTSDPFANVVRPVSDSIFYHFDFTNYLTPGAVNISFQGFVTNSFTPSGITVTVSEDEYPTIFSVAEVWTVSNYLGTSSHNFSGLTAGSDYWVTVDGSSNGASGEYRLDFSLAPVPEPETYAMLLAGLGLLGVVARRRKQQAS